jgi:hypothetical protein
MCGGDGRAKREEHDEQRKGDEGESYAAGR